MAAERPVFLAPHFDDVALSCGGTVAGLVDEGRAPLIVTVFAGRPTVPGGAFSRFQHERWGMVGDPIAARREEDRHAAAMLGADILWLDFLDAIYRGERYTSDAQLFGDITAEDAGLPREVWAELLAALETCDATPEPLYVPLGAGNHVDHQLMRAVGQLAAAEGIRALAYEDYPYAGDPGREDEVFQLAARVSGQAPYVRRLTDDELERRIAAIRCYPSQLPVIFRHQGEPRVATERWTRRVGDGKPAERFWMLPATRS